MSDSKYDPAARYRNASRREVMRALALGSAAAVAGPRQTAQAARIGVQPSDSIEPDFEPPEIVDPETTGLAETAAIEPALGMLVQDATDRLKYVFAATAAGAGAGRNQSRLSQSFSTYLATRSPAQQQRVRAKAAAMMTPAGRRSFGRYGAAVTPEEATTLSPTELTAKAGGPILQPGSLTVQRIGIALALSRKDYLQMMHEAAEQEAAEAQAAADAAAAADLAAGKKYTYMECYIRRVTCIQSSEAQDEILLGGYYVGATGLVHHVPQWKVSDNFEPASDGGKVNNGDDSISARDYKKINGKHWGWFNIVQKSPWPHDYNIGIVMGEEDWGGFGSTLSDIWDAVGDYIKAAITGAVSSVIPIPGLGYLIGWAIGKFIDWIIQGLNDDLVGQFSCTTTLSKMTKTYYDRQFPTSNWPKRKGKLTSKWGVTLTRACKGNGQGHYDVKIGWRVFTEAGYNARQSQIAMLEGRRFASL